MVNEFIFLFFSFSFVLFWIPWVSRNVIFFVFINFFLDVFLFIFISFLLVLLRCNVFFIFLFFLFSLLSLFSIIVLFFLL